MSFIEFHDVKKIYKMGEVTINAVEGVSFNIEQGEFCVVVGASGAGKTTVLNILGGMDTCTKGSIIVGGRDISKLKDKQLIEYRRFDIGFVFQFYNLVPNLTAKENVELATQISKNPMDSTEALESVGLSQRSANFPAQLSGGEQQRVALARALVNEPPILLADEPTGNLDPKNSWEIMKLLERINEERGTTILVVTHNREIVNEMKKRVITMKKGVVISDEEKGGYIDED